MAGRLVAVATQPLWPVRDGISLRIVELLEHLASRWSTRLIAPAPHGDSLPPAIRVVRVVSARPEGPWSPAPRHDALRPVERALQQMLAQEPADILLLWVGAEALAFGLSGLPPVVGDRIDAMTLAAARDVSLGKGVRRVVRDVRTVYAYARYEREVVRSQRATVVVGEDDARMLRRISGRTTVHVVPNGVITEPEPPAEREAPEPIVIFSGVLAYPPNVAAVTWFAAEVWPRIRAAEPRARFVVAGRTPVPQVRALDGRDGIEVRGDVPDMRAQLEHAWVAVAPMRSGTGIKNKVLEAWAAAKPVVLTRVASNGLTLDADAASLIADEPAGFAACVVQLLRDRADRVRLGRAAHALARDRHGWGEAAERLHQLLAAAAAQG